MIAGFFCAREVFAAPKPPLLETATAALAEPWLKALNLPLSPDAIIHAMNPYHYQRFFSQALKQTIHKMGMLGFYADAALMNGTLSLLASEVHVRSQYMQFGGLYYSRNITGEGFWEVVNPAPGVFHLEITNTILNAIKTAGGGSLMLIQPYASRDQMAGGYPADPNKAGWFDAGDLFPLKNPIGPGPVVSIPEYKDFIVYLQKHTGQQIFEIANEMDGGSGASYSPANGGGAKYANLIKATRQALGSDVKILNGGSIGMVTDPMVSSFWDDFFKAGGGKDISALNIHYGEVNWDDPKAFTYDPTFFQLRDVLDFYNNVMAKYNSLKDIWITEFPIGDPRLSEQQIAEWYVKKFSFAAARNVKKIFIELADGGQSVAAPNLMPLGRGAMLYIVGQSNPIWVAQLIYYTQKLMNWKLTGFTQCTELLFAQQYRFEVKGKPVFVLWGESPIPTAIAGVPIKITDAFGKETYKTVPSGALVRDLIGSPDKPVFVELM